MDQLTIHTLPARIVERSLSIEQLTSLINADLGEITPFFWTAEISNNNLDFYFGRMAESTLRNFAQDATNGVPFLDSHNTRNLGYGQSIAGTFETRDGKMRAVADFYTIPGLRFGNQLTYQSTDDFILAAKTRLVRDVSVGFHSGESICDICGEDIFAIDWENWRYACPHMPGVEYPIGDRGESVVLATFTQENSHLGEVSGVYDGATPGAMIEKANRMVQSGQMPADVAQRVEVKYRIKLPEQKRNWAGVDTKRGKKMSEPTNDLLTQIREVLAEAKAPGNEVEGVRWLVDNLRKSQAAEAELLTETERLKPLATDGEAYRTDLIEEALKEGVRAMGDNFAADAYKEMLESASLDRIKEVRDKFAAQAKATFPKKRESVDEDEQAGAVVVDLLNFKRKVPESSYSN